jgi:outer membrane protein assembly factor BamA
MRPQILLTMTTALMIVLTPPTTFAQAAPGGTAALKEVKSDGQKKLTEAQIAALTGLQPGAQVGRDDLQKAADKLVSSGLFATVKYDFKTRKTA